MVSSNDLFEILSWLPAKPLIRLSTVNKSISNLIKEPKFIQHHSHNWLKRNSWSDEDDSDGYGFFIQPESYSSTTILDRLELFWLGAKTRRRTAGIPNTSLQYMKKTSRILASSNGLILSLTLPNNYNEKTSDLYLCNPATRVLTHIGLPEYSKIRLLQLYTNYPLYAAFFINRKNSNGDYTIWIFENEDEEWRSVVEYMTYWYDQDYKVWRMKGKICTGGRNVIMDRPPVFYEGEVYFVSDCGMYFTKSSPNYLPYIVACNVEKSTSRFIKLPRDAYRGFDGASMRLFPWEEEEDKRSAICLVRLKGHRSNLSLTVWVLRDVKRRKSWRRVDKIRVKRLGLGFSEHEEIAGFLVMSGWLIFASSERVYKYGLIGKNRGSVEDLGSHGCGHKVRLDAYVNTLQSCGRLESTRIPNLIMSSPVTSVGFQAACDLSDS